MANPLRIDRNSRLEATSSVDSGFDVTLGEGGRSLCAPLFFANNITETHATKPSLASTNASMHVTHLVDLVGGHKAKKLDKRFLGASNPKRCITSMVSCKPTPLLHEVGEHAPSIGLC